MSERAFYALVRRELHRGRRSFLLLLGFGLMALVGAVFSDGPLAAFAIIIGMLGSFLSLGGPSSELGEDKIHGYLEHDRSLPLSLRLVAAGRLTGAAIRQVPIGICALAIAIAIAKEERLAGLGTPLLVLLPIIAVAGASMLSWTLLALNARWSFRNLWWVPVTIFLSPQIARSLLPDATQAALGRWLRAFGRGFVAFAETPPGAILLLALLAVVPVLVFWGATLLYASGLERYRHDPNFLGQVLGKAPKRELAAVGRGPLLAVTRLRVRIAAEQQWRQLLVLGGLLVAIAVGGEQIRQFAEFYVKVMAVMLPGGIALQLVGARATGYLEGMQQLPHPARTIALGHLAAVAIMAVPGALIVMALKAVAGDAVRTVDGLTLWGVYVGGAWVAAVAAVWLKRRHLLLYVALPVGLIIVAALIAGAERSLLVGSALVEGLRTLRSATGAALPLAVAAIVATLGIPIFAKGLENYQVKRA